MTQNRLTYLLKFFLCLVAAFSFQSGDSLLLAQETAESSAPRIDILQMNGSKASLNPTGDGISYYKIGDLYKRGTTQVKLLDEKFKLELPIDYALFNLVDGKFKPELPIGYTLFKNLSYIVETTAVFTGPCDIEFVVPSVLTKESFDKLRILYAEVNRADPEIVKWVDITLDDSMSDYLKQFITAAEIRSRLPNFKARTIHAFTTWEPQLIVIALRDSSKTRENFRANLIVSGTASPQVTEGRTFTTNLKVTNEGPATATNIVLNVDEAREFVSATPTQGACRQSAQSVFCTFPSLEPDKSIEIKIVEKCPWFARESSTNEDATLHMILRKRISVKAAEKDPVEENNEIELGTEVFVDSNKGPLVEAIGPQRFEVFPGPNASVPLRVRASDPDGVVNKVEFFEEGQLIGTGTLKAENEYELLYRNVPFGTHKTGVKVTDNLGRDASLRMPDFFVNGLANVEITNPKPGSKLQSEDGDILVTIHATHPSAPIKKVSLNVWGTDATPIGNDDYLVRLKYGGRKYSLQAIATDQAGIETQSEFVEFVVAEPLQTEIRWFDGEYIQRFDAQTEFKVNELVLAANVQHKTQFSPDAKISKIEYFVDGNLICTKGEQKGGFFDSSKGCIWKIPSSGHYKLQAVATDEDGMVGRSRVVDVTIQKP